MKGADLVLRASSPLLVFGGLAVAQEPAKLASNMIETVKDPIQGGFRTFMTFTLADQPIRALLDTGSSDLTVQRRGSDICKDPAQQCDGKSKTGEVFGAFDTQKANNVTQLDVPLNTSFTGGAAFQGEFVEAPFQFGDGNAIDLQTGVIESGNPPPGGVLFPVLGVGPEGGESTLQDNGTYPNLPARLKKAGEIKRNAFGLYLGDFRSPDNGTIVWGGFDAAKFDGELQKVDIEPDLAGNMPSFVVSLSSVRMTNMRDGSIGGGADGQGSGDQENGRGQGNGGEQSGRDQGIDGQRNPNRSNQKDETSPRRRSAWTGPVRRLSPHHNYKRASEPLSENELQKRQRDGNLLTQQGQVVLVDTGDPSLGLPLDAVEAIAEMLNGRPDEKTGNMRVDCDRIQGMALTVGMGNDRAKIDIPLEPMVLGPDFDKDLPGFLDQGQTGGPGGGGDNARGRGQDSRGGADDNGNDGPQGRGGGNSRLRGGGPRRRDIGDSSRGGRDSPRDQGGANGRIGDGDAQGSRGDGNGARASGGCQLPIVPIEGGEPLSIFGSPAMQAMYVVFDMDSQALMFGQARLNETRTDLRELVSSDKGLQVGGGETGQESGQGQGGERGQESERGDRGRKR